LTSSTWRERLGAGSQSGRGRADAGIVDEAVQAPVAVHDGLDSRSRSPASVTSQATASTPGQLALQAREPARPPRGEHRDRAGAGQRARELLAEPELAPVTMMT
jgi:hypothetical protein